LKRHPDAKLANQASLESSRNQFATKENFEAYFEKACALFAENSYWDAHPINRALSISHSRIFTEAGRSFSGGLEQNIAQMGDRTGTGKEEEERRQRGRTLLREKGSRNSPDMHNVHHLHNVHFAFVRISSNIEGRR